jgi:hypothetical protein
MQTEKMSILKALENVHLTSKDSLLLMERYETRKCEIGQISNYFEISEMQSILLASVFSLACLNEIELKELIAYFNIEKINLLPHITDLQYLVDKNILKKDCFKDILREDYSINNSLLEFIIANETIPKILITIKPKEDSFHEFLKEVDELREKKSDKLLNQTAFELKLDCLLYTHSKYKLVHYIHSELSLLEAFVFFDTIIDVIAKCNNDFPTNLQSTVNDFTDKRKDSFEFIGNFLTGKTKLNSLHLVEKNQTEFGNQHRIKLTDKAIKLIHEMEGLSVQSAKLNNENLLYPDKIQIKNLHYNAAEANEILRIDASLSKAAFTNLQKRLKANKMPIGLNILLYGAPGTGKTETVYQMAKKHKRPIYKVDISATKSMWFGESQKLVKQIFTDYYELKKKEKICPILLFNEADAVLGKRKAAGSSSVADTENAIQNILLEELENFDGILFATSNLVANLDPAFERRFLFKIKFGSPSVEIAANIWKTKLNNITNQQAVYLAENYKYSGGEMENIARKCLLEEVIVGKKLNFDTVISFCNSEKWNKQNQIKIGY